VRIVHDQDAPPAPVRVLSIDTMRGDRRGTITDHGQAERELAATVGPVSADIDAATIQLDQALHLRQADAQGLIPHFGGRSRVRSLAFSDVFHDDALAGTHRGAAGRLVVGFDPREEVQKRLIEAMVREDAAGAVTTGPDSVAYVTLTGDAVATRTQLRPALFAR